MSYRVIISGLVEEAPRWDAMAADARQVEAFVASAKMGVTAFFMVDPSVVGRLLGWDTLAQAPIHAAAYEEFRSTVDGLMSGAVTEFGQIGDAVTKMANKYHALEESGVTEFRDIDLGDVYRA